MWEHTLAPPIRHAFNIVALFSHVRGSVRFSDPFLFNGVLLRVHLLQQCEDKQLEH